LGLSCEIEIAQIPTRATRQTTTVLQATGLPMGGVRSVPIPSPP